MRQLGAIVLFRVAAAFAATAKGQSAAMISAMIPAGSSVAADGRLILIVSPLAVPEPRLQVRLEAMLATPYIFGRTVAAMHQGALSQHMGKVDAARSLAKANIVAWETEIARGLDAIVVTTSGCGTTIKDYRHLFAGDDEWEPRAARVAALARDITEVMAATGLQPPVIAPGITVAYHSACSLQHGQEVTIAPRSLLTDAGFVVREIGEGHICCGSAGSYSILQPELSRGLRDRKLACIASTGANVVATGNIGCISQLKSGGATIVHTVELLDWATGGSCPDGV